MMWKESYRLGVDSIDTQHQELFRMTEELIRAIDRNADAAAYEAALGFLKDYVIYHFQDEEQYQVSIGYSGMEQHKQEHRQFTQTVLDYEKRLKETGFDRAVMKDLAGTVTAWLIYHVADTDQRITASKPAQREEKQFGQWVDQFAHSTAQVMETMAGYDSSGFRQLPLTEGTVHGDVLIEIGLVGQLKGRAVFGFSRQLALSLVGSMTMMELEELDELVQSALCELTNISCGSATISLAQQGLACDIRPPVISEKAAADSPGGGVCLDTGSGSLEVALVLDGAPGQE